jgi:hypothetical protein
VNSTLIRLLVLGVPGFCFVAIGALNDEYPFIALGGILVIDALYGVNQKRGIIRDQSRERRSFVIPALIGGGLAISGFASHSYVVAAAGTAILVGALLRLSGRSLAKR